MVPCWENRKQHCALRVTHRVLVIGVYHSLLCRLLDVVGKRFARIYPDPHTTTITLSSIVVLDFLPPLVMTSLLEQALDWLTRREYPPKFRFFNSRDSNAQFAPQDCLSRLCIDLSCKSFARFASFASFASGVNAPSDKSVSACETLS